jgi:hypothetical protein
MERHFEASPKLFRPKRFTLNVINVVREVFLKLFDETLFLIFAFLSRKKVFHVSAGATAHSGSPQATEKLDLKKMPILLGERYFMPNFSTHF